MTEIQLLFYILISALSTLRESSFNMTRGGGGGMKILKLEA